VLEFEADEDRVSRGTLWIDEVLGEALVVDRDGSDHDLVKAVPPQVLGSHSGLEQCRSRVLDDLTDA
jgi:hypothetical protein